MNKRKSWTFAEKKSALSFLNNHSIKETMDRFSVTRSTLDKWNRRKDCIDKTRNPKGRRLEGGGRKITDIDIERSALNFVANCRERGHAVTGPLIQAHVESLAETKSIDLNASSGWLTGFKKRHNLVSRWVTGFVQKSPKELEPKIRAYLELLAETKQKHGLGEDVRIWNFDETPLYFDMPLSTTLEVKSSKHVFVHKALSERKRFTAGLMVSSKGDKLRPYLIFPGKRGIVAHDSKQIVCVKQTNGFMDTKRFHDWIEQIVTPYRKTNSSKDILLLDAFTVHCDKQALTRLRALNFIPIFIPGGCTAYLQPLDVVINKPFKDHFRSHYRSWMADDKSHSFTPKGNMRAARPEEVTKWVSSAWSKIEPEMVAKSFIASGAIQTGDDEDEEEEKFLEKLRAKWQSKLSVKLSTNDTPQKPS